MGVGGVSSESPNFSDFRDPGTAEHRCWWPPSWPQRRWTVIRLPSSKGCRGRRWQDREHMVAPGSPATRGCGGRGSWPFRRMGSLGGSCPSTRQQIPPGWQDGTSHSVHRCGPEGRDGVSGRGDVGKYRARHSSQNGELAAQGRQAWTAMEEGPGPHREGQGPSGCG